MRDEDSTFVADVTVDGGEFDEAAAVEKVEGVVGDEVAVQGGVVGEEWLRGCVGVWEVVDYVLGLERGDVQSSQAGERVLVVGAVGTLHKSVILILRFIDCSQGAKRLRLRNGTVEEVVVPAIVSCELKRYTSSTCRSSPNHDVARISTEAGNMIMHPVQCHTLIFQPVVEAASAHDFGAGKETVGTDSVVD